MTWLETASETFVARHDEHDEPEIDQVLRGLEGARERMERHLGVHVGELHVVLHGSEAQLDAAAPLLPVQRRMTHPAGRRYVVGMVARDDLHVLSPRILARRASNVEGSLETLMLAPLALLAKRLVIEANPKLGRRWDPRSARRAWLLEGAGQYLSGQTRHLRPVITRRLREGDPPSFPPARPDAPLLGGTVLDLLAREEGERAVAAVIRGDTSLEAAFGGRALRHTDAAWRSHLSHLAENRERRPRLAAR